MSASDIPIDRHPDGLTAGFWEAAREYRLVAQRCRSCRQYRHYPQLLCPACFSSEWDWDQISGRGTVYSFTVTHQAFHPAWADRVPYALITVELDEGVRMISDLPADQLDEVAIGRRVEVYFDDVDETLTMPHFRLV